MGRCCFPHEIIIGAKLETYGSKTYGPNKMNKHYKIVLNALALIGKHFYLE